MLDAYADGRERRTATRSARRRSNISSCAPRRSRGLPEDSILTVLAMFNTLQGRQAAFEQSHGALRDTLPEPMFRFLSTAGSEWETPVVGNPIQRPPIPGAGRL